MAHTMKEAIAELGELVSNQFKAYEARIKHLERCLVHISDTTNDPELAQFAFRASENPPSAFPPEEHDPRTIVTPINEVLEDLADLAVRRRRG